MAMHKVLEQLEERLEALVARHEEAKARIAALDARVAELEEALEQAMADRAAAEEALESARKDDSRAAELERELETLRKSTAERLEQVLRRIDAVLEDEES